MLFRSTIKTVHIKPGDKVAEGTLIATLEVSDAAPAAPAETAPASAPTTVESAPAPTPVAEPVKVEQPKPATAPVVSAAVSSEAFKAHATPSVRLYARELGVDLVKIQTGTGRKGRILKSDVQNFVKQVMSSGVTASGGAGIPSFRLLISASSAKSKKNP